MASAALLKKPAHTNWACVTILNGLDADDNSNNPSNSNIDVEVNGDEEVSNLGYGRSRTIKLTPGSYSFQAFDSDTNPLGTDGGTLVAGGDYTLLVYGDLDNGTTVELFTNDLSPTGKLKARIETRDRLQGEALDDLDFYGTYQKSSRSPVVIGPSNVGDDLVAAGVWPGKLTFNLYDSGTTSGSYASETILVAPRFVYFIYSVGDVDNGTADLLVEKRLARLK
jgi:hypothetical protein